MYRVIGKGNANVILLDEHNPAVVVRLAYATCGMEEVGGFNSAVWSSRIPSLLAGLHVAMPSHQLEQFVHNLGTRVVHKATLATHSDWPVAGEISVGMVLPNMHWLPNSVTTYTIEIKPKCGFLPQTRLIHPDNSIKLHTCRYQLHQHLKLQKGAVSALSSYTPMELFSSQDDRQKSALFALLENPQNNFKFWLNGQLQKLPIREIRHAVDGQAGLSWVSLIDVLQSILRASAVLDAILAVQSLDQWDIEGIYPLYCHALHHFRNGYEHYGHTSMCEDPWTCAWFKRWHSTCEPSSSPKMSSEWTTAHLALHRSSWNVVISTLRQYLIAMAAKDCSIMCSFTAAKDSDFDSASSDQTERRQISPAVEARPGTECNACKQAASSLPGSFTQVHTCCHLLKTSNYTFRYRIAIMDLDRKHIGRIAVQKQLDQAILDCCEKISFSPLSKPA